MYKSSFNQYLNMWRNPFMVWANDWNLDCQHQTITMVRWWVLSLNMWRLGLHKVLLVFRLFSGWLKHSKFAFTPIGTGTFICYSSNFNWSFPQNVIIAGFCFWQRSIWSIRTGCDLNAVEHLLRTWSMCKSLIIEQCHFVIKQ